MESLNLLVNGEPTTSVAVADRGLQFGDGLFESVRVIDGQARYWDSHMQRLARGCERLRLPIPGAQVLAKDRDRLIRDEPNGVLKILWTAGPGGRGYTRALPLFPTRVMIRYPLPMLPKSWCELGLTLRFCDIRLGINPGLAGIKHLNRLEQVLAAAESNDPAIHEGLLMDTQDRVIEGIISNVFVIKNNVVYTPSLANCGVEGIMREHVLEALPALGLQAHIGDLTKDDCLTADEMFVCNSVRGILPVACLESRRFQQRAVTQRIQEHLSEPPPVLWAPS